MPKKSKQFLIWIACMGLVAGITLSGCGNSDEPPPTHPADAPAGGSPPSSATGGVPVDPRPAQPNQQRR